MKAVLRPLAWILAGALLAGGAAFAEYQPKGKRDPFVPLLTSEGQRIHPPGAEEGQQGGLGNLILQGIVFDPKADSYAVISGQVVREQEELEGVKVVRIEPDSVTVLVDGQSHRLTVQEPEKKEPTEEMNTR